MSSNGRLRRRRASNAMSSDFSTFILISRRRPVLRSEYRHPGEFPTCSANAHHQFRAISALDYLLCFSHPRRLSGQIRESGDDQRAAPRPARTLAAMHVRGSHERSVVPVPVWAMPSTLGFAWPPVLARAWIGVGDNSGPRDRQRLQILGFSQAQEKGCSLQARLARISVGASLSSLGQSFSGQRRAIRS